MDCLYSVLVYMLADFVLALELKDLAVKVMGTIFELNLTIQPWVDESSQLINAKSFAHAIYYVYKETNEGPQFAPLRKAVTDGMRQLHLAEYYGIDAELRKLIGEIGEFAVDFFSSMEEHRKGWMAGIELPFGN